MTQIFRKWIIPARAGFTWWPHPGRGTAADHPRSRGVYKHSSAKKVKGKGSSPLARGLRRRLAVRVATRGIIPARAGFTAIRFPNVIFKEDHPRSRGVYGHVP